MGYGAIKPHKPQIIKKEEEKTMRTHYITMREASLMIADCFSKCRVKYHNNKRKERVEIEFEDPDTLDIIEVIIENGLYESITITTDEAIDEYLVRE
jgi:hypothetical protein